MRLSVCLDGLCGGSLQPRCATIKSVVIQSHSNDNIIVSVISTLNIIGFDCAAGLTFGLESALELELLSG